MVNFKINGTSFELSGSEKVNLPLMVCSHERSGTHFVMNSISKCTEYTANPFLNFDYSPLGSLINFFSEESIRIFLNSLKNIKDNNSINYCTNSIIKSHFPLTLLGHDAKNLCKVIYIYRNPEEVFISYWKFLHRLDWFEGPKLNSPLELMKINPKGQSQRYQIENYKNYFERWASHILIAKKEQKNSKNIVMVNYSDLENNFRKTIKNICNKLEINIISTPSKPNKEEYVHGKHLKLNYKEKQLMKSFIREEIQKFPDLPNDLKALFN